MAPKGKYFLFKGKRSGLYMDVTGQSKDPGARVIIASKTGNDSQIWYHHPLTQTIRSKHSNHCFDITERIRLEINYYQEGKPEQKWVYNKEKMLIESPVRYGQILAVTSYRTDPGAGIDSCPADDDNDNQKWEIETLPVSYFKIRSATCDKVLDVEGANKSPGAKVILYQHKVGADNQLWYEDFYGNIRSKLNEKLCLDATSGVLKTGVYVEGQPRLFWVIDGTKIVNKYDHKEVLDLKGGSTADGTEVIPFEFHGGANQQWRLDYV